MRLKFALLMLAMAMLACASLGTPQPAPQSATVPETISPTEALALQTENTPLSPTIAAPIASSFTVTSLCMLNELDGWGIAENAILRTTDGGSTWYNLSPQGVTEFGYGTASTFLNATQAWVMVADASDPAGSGLLYRTEDGGLTWTVYPVPFGSGKMAFADEANGWMMSALGAGAGSMAIAIYRSEDGGATWKQVYSNDPNAENAGSSLPLGGIKNSLMPLNAQTAWVGGVTYAPDTFYLYKTSDGGQTWTPQTIPVAPGMQDVEIAIDTGPIFTSSNEGILPIRFSGENYRTGFYATHDGGVNWEFVSFMPGSGAVDFVSSSEGFFWTGEQFFFTTDGAQTWTSVNPNILFGDTFMGMDFVDTSNGWVWTYDQTGRTGLYKTTDGGATWFPLGN